MKDEAWPPESRIEELARRYEAGLPLFPEDDSDWREEAADPDRRQE